MFKRILALALVLSVVLALFPATAPAQEEVNCGTEDEVTITLIAGQVGQELEAVQNVANDFMAACPNITVNVTTRPTSSTDTLAQYQQFFDAQSSEIDVYQLDVIWPGIVAEHMIDLMPYLTEEDLADFVQGNIINNTVDGRLVALPWFAGSGMLYYRTDLLEKYGYDAPPQTWEELGEMARTIQEGERAENPDFWGFVYQGNAYEGLTCDALEWQASVGGGVIITPEGVVDVNNPAFIDILDMMASWIGDIVPEAVTTFQEEDARAVWQAGNAAFMRNWGYAYTLGNAEDSVIAGLFDVAPLPGGEPGMTAATLGGWELGVSRYSANPDAAAAFAVFATSTEQQIKYVLARGEAPTRLSVYDDPQIQEELPFLRADVIAAAVARPSTVAGAGYAQVSELYYTAVHSVLTGDADAATAMEDLELALGDLGFELP